MMASYADTLRDLSDDQVNRLGRRQRTLVRTFLVIVAASILGGLWVDWRLLPTTIVPLTFLVIFALGFSGTQDEIIRRNRMCQPRDQRDHE